MRVRYNRKEDILTLELSEAVINHAEESGPLIAHFGEDDRLVLIEILEASDFLAKLTSSRESGGRASGGGVAVARGLGGFTGPAARNILDTWASIVCAAWTACAPCSCVGPEWHGGRGEGIRLEFPFQVKGLGEAVEVIGLDDERSSERRGLGWLQYAVALADLEVVQKDTETTEWLVAYRYWLG